MAVKMEKERMYILFGQPKLVMSFTVQPNLHHGTQFDPIGIIVNVQNMSKPSSSTSLLDNDNETETDWFQA